MLLTRRPKLLVVVGALACALAAGVGGGPAAEQAASASETAVLARMLKFLGRGPIESLSVKNGQRA
jgi:hypothetical protein